MFPGWATAIIVILLLGLLAFLIYWFVFRDTSDVTGTSVDNEFRIVSRIFNLGVDQGVGKALTTANLSEWDTHCTEETPGNWVCTPVTDASTGLLRPPVWNSDIYRFNRPNEAGNFEFNTWSEGTTIVPLDNISGNFSNIVLNYGTDFWSNGFDTEPTGTDAEIEALVNTMAQNVEDNSVLLLGEDTLPPNKNQGKYEFDILQGSTFFTPRLTAEEVTLAQSSTHVLGDHLYRRAALCSRHWPEAAAVPPKDQ